MKLVLHELVEPRCEHVHFLEFGAQAGALNFAKSVTEDLVGEENTRPQIRDGKIVPRVLRDGVAVREVIKETETYIDF
jgi:hypothetical protein